MCFFVYHMYKKGFKKCGLPYEDHTSEKAMFIQLKRNLTVSQVQEELIRVDTEFKRIHGEKEYIDGICFVETSEKFRITE